MNHISQVGLGVPVVPVAILVESESTSQGIEDDPADNRMLECAVAGRASYIVSGNNSLLRLEAYKGIVILNPTGFLIRADVG